MSAKKGLLHVCLEIAGILGQINPQDYNTRLALLNGSSLGQHFRHILDFFHCLALAGETGVVDYANRERSPAAEADPHYTARAFEVVLNKIERMDEAAFLQMRADFQDIPEEQRALYPTSAGREMTFVHDHAIHHLAMINIGIKEYCPYILTPEYFGVAPSTIKYRTDQQ